MEGQVSLHLLLNSQEVRHLYSEELQQLVLVSWLVQLLNPNQHRETYLGEAPLLRINQAKLAVYLAELLPNKLNLHLLVEYLEEQLKHNSLKLKGVLDFLELNHQLPLLDKVYLDSKPHNRTLCLGVLSQVEHFSAGKLNKQWHPHNLWRLLILRQQQYLKIIRHF